jgi:hypothetical protein
MKLFDKLKEFNANINGESNINDIQNRFEELAPVFLYGGYINVHDDFNLYIRTVEFYFHSEKDNGVHDPIVYHRNGRDLEQTPYFPLMSLHAHNSGFDITFEKPGEYRASALIRSYEVIDIRDKKNGNKYLKWDSDNNKFVESDNYCFNTQSTYLYALLNGFSLGQNNDIIWEDVPRVKTKDIKVKTRQNVLKSKSDFVYDKIIGEKCTRNWSFTREDEI